MENPAKRSLKKSLTGFEVEMFTINREGYIVGEADKLLKKSKSDRNFTIKKECAANMIEIASYPGENVRNTMDYLLRELEYLVSISEKEKIHIELMQKLRMYSSECAPKISTDLQPKPKVKNKAD